jgi:serine/threonine protein kinase
LTAEHRKRLVKEAQTLARLRHPNIVGVYEVGVDDGRMFIALEYIQGRTVRQWLAAETRPWPEIVRVFLAAGEGLAAAHARGLVHRDFKPDNVMVADDGSVRVLDFGLAKDDGAILSEMTAQRPRKPGALTQTGALLGTPLYMSPEQFGGRGVDVRSDQFAFCVSLYEALYDEHPFPTGAMTELQAAIEAGKVRPEPKTTAVPRWIRAVLLRGLAARRAQRWPSMQELLAQLRRDPARTRRRRLACSWSPAWAGAPITCTRSASLPLVKRRRQRSRTHGARPPEPRPSERSMAPSSPTRPRRGRAWSKVSMHTPRRGAMPGLARVGRSISSRAYLRTWPRPAARAWMIAGELCGCSWRRSSSRPRVCWGAW